MQNGNPRPGSEKPPSLHTFLIKNERVVCEQTNGEEMQGKPTKSEKSRKPFHGTIS